MSFEDVKVLSQVVMVQYQCRPGYSRQTSALVENHHPQSAKKQQLYNRYLICIYEIDAIHYFHNNP